VLATALANQGCDVIATARSLESLSTLQQESPGIVARACDVRETRSIAALFASVDQQFGRLDILINNAGIAHPLAPVDQLNAQFWHDVIATNLTGMFLMTQAALPLMSSGSTIVNNLSVAAKGVFAGESAYCASKHGALGFTKTLREELRPKGIRVIALMPGPTSTEMWNQFWPEAPREKMMSPETVAQAVINALLLPANSTLEELVLSPTVGTL
jgi:NAD(P)-dependent dehydrogenase (short-subunit alcohol dehydrogenase family)